MSSNWREFTNVVESLEHKGRQGLLNGSETFMLTDNDVTDKAYAKGYSSSPLLCSLVLRLYKLELMYDCIIHVIHVSGARMCAQGTDGISRGDQATGSMLGKSILEFVPFHLNPIQRSPALAKWVKCLGESLSATVLEPEDWFCMERRKEEVCIWVLPPAAGDVGMEQLGFSRHKRPHGLHIVLVPRLMTGRWRRRLIRSTDVYVHLSNEILWPMGTHFEPLLMFIALPFCVHSPKFEERQGLLEKLERCLQEPGVQEIHQGWRRDRLCKLLLESRKLSAV